MDEPGVEQRCADGHVLLRHLEALVDGPRRVADLEAQIPQQIEHVLGDALAPGRLLVGEQEENIDVGAGREQAAAIAAGGDDGHALGVRGVGGAVDVGDRVVEEQCDQLILKPGEAVGALAALTVGFELLPGLLAGGLDQPLAALEYSGTSLGGCAVGIEQRRQFDPELLGIEIRRGSEGGRIHVGKSKSCWRGGARSGAGLLVRECLERAQLSCFASQAGGRDVRPSSPSEPFTGKVCGISSSIKRHRSA